VTMELRTLTSSTDNPMHPVEHQHVNSQVKFRHATSNHPRPLVRKLDGIQACKDGQVLDQVMQALRESGFEQLRRIQAYCDHGRITLQGRIATYYLKQVAQEVVRTVTDVRDIDNDLQVVCSR